MMRQILKSILRCHSISGKILKSLSFMAKTETLHKQEFYKTCGYATLTVLLKIILGSQCKKFITSAHLSISLSYNVVFNASITLLWKQHYFKSWFLFLGILIIFVPCSCLRWSGNVSQDSNIPDTGFHFLSIWSNS